MSSERERIARIIDPWPFEFLDDGAYNATAKDREREALAKADAILSPRAEPTEAVARLVALAADADAGGEFDQAMRLFQQAAELTAHPAPAEAHPAQACVDEFVKWMQERDYGTGDGYLFDHDVRRMLNDLEADLTAPAEAPSVVGALALSRVRDWLRFDVPIGTPAATTMLGVVNEALAALAPAIPAEDAA